MPIRSDAVWHAPITLPAAGASRRSARSFPMDKSYSAISISGFDVQKMGLSLTVSRDAKADAVRGSGNAGCNRWTANVILRDDQIDFTDIVTTKNGLRQAEDDGRGRVPDIAAVGETLARGRRAS